MRECKRNAVVFKMFIPWLCNQCHFTHAVIRSKMIPSLFILQQEYEEQTHHENKLENAITQILCIPLENGQ